MNLQLSFSLNTHDIDIAILKNCERKTNYYKIIVIAVSDNPISFLDTWVPCLVGSHPDKKNLAMGLLHSFNSVSLFLIYVWKRNDFVIIIIIMKLLLFY